MKIIILLLNLIEAANHVDIYDNTVLEKSQRLFEAKKASEYK